MECIRVHVVQEFAFTNHPSVPVAEIYRIARRRKERRAAERNCDGTFVGLVRSVAGSNSGPFRGAAARLAHAVNKRAPLTSEINSSRRVRLLSCFLIHRQWRRGARLASFTLAGTNFSVHRHDRVLTLSVITCTQRAAFAGRAALDSFHLLRAL